MTDEVDANEEGYLVVEVSYSIKWVLPYKDGIVLMTMLQGAENIKNDTITPLDVDALTFKILTRDAYVTKKMHKLIGATDP